jgi:hypothetical protein
MEFIELNLHGNLTGYKHCSLFISFIAVCEVNLSVVNCQIDGDIEKTECRSVKGRKSPAI